LATYVVPLSGCFVPQIKGIDPQKYFQKLDYGRPEVAAAIPEYEDKLWNVVEQLRPALLDRTQKKMTQSAMALVYAAFYMGNANYGAMNGAINYGQLTQFRRFALRETDLASELAAREQAAHDLLSLAQKTLPDEPMINGYLATSHLRKNFDLSGRISQDDIEAVVIAAEKDPPFNLFSALIALDGFTPRADLQERIYRVLDDMTSGNGPCDQVAPARGCFPNLSIVPFAFQGSRVIAGDAYLKRALTRLAVDASDSAGRDYVRRALRQYRMLFDKLRFFGGIYRLTQSWPLKDSVKERIDVAKTMLSGTLPSTGFLYSPKYKAVYRCASCHSQSLEETSS
jgi:hypothetical protein